MRSWPVPPVYKDTASAGVKHCLCQARDLKEVSHIGKPHPDGRTEMPRSPTGGRVRDGPSCQGPDDGSCPECCLRSSRDTSDLPGRRSPGLGLVPRALFAVRCRENDTGDLRQAGSPSSSLAARGLDARVRRILWRQAITLTFRQCPPEVETRVWPSHGVSIATRTDNLALLSSRSR